MKLRTVKESVEDVGYIESEELLRGFLTSHQSLEGLASKEDLDAVLVQLASLSILLHKGVFNISAPINIASNPDIENTAGLQEGTMYWDYVNKRLRLLTNKGWETK